MDLERGEAGPAVEAAQVHHEAGVAGHGRQARAADRGAEQAASVADRARRAFGRVGLPQVSGAAQAERVGLHLQQIGDVERARVKAMAVAPRLPEGDLQVAGYGERETGVVGPAHKAVGFGPRGLVDHGHPQVREEREVEGMGQKGRPRVVAATVGQERTADAAVEEIELRGQRTALAVDPAEWIRIVLERRRATMEGDHVRPRPSACRRVRVGAIALRFGISPPRANHMPDLVSEHTEQGSLPGFLEKLSVQLNHAETRLRGTARGTNARVASPAGGFSEFVILDIDLEVVARLASRPDPHPGFNYVVVPKRALEVSGGPLPRGPGVGNPAAPHLAAALEQGVEGLIEPHRRSRAREVELDRQGVRGTARPPAVGNAMAGAEEPDLVARVKLRGDRCPFARRLGGAKPLRVGPVGIRSSRAQGQAFHDALDAPVPPMVEQIGGPRILVRTFGLSETSPRRLQRGHAAGGRGDRVRRPAARRVRRGEDAVAARACRFEAAVADAAGHGRYDADEHRGGQHGPADRFEDHSPAPGRERSFYPHTAANRVDPGPGAIAVEAREGARATNPRRHPSPSCPDLFRVPSSLHRLVRSQLTPRCRKKWMPGTPPDLICRQGMTTESGVHGSSCSVRPSRLSRARAPQRWPANPALKSSRTRTPPMPSWDGPRNAPVACPASSPNWMNALPRTVIR